MKKAYCIKCNKYRNFKNSKISYFSNKTLVSEGFFFHKYIYIIPLHCGITPLITFFYFKIKNHFKYFIFISLVR